MSRPVKDLTGHKYNRWTVVAFSHLNSGSHWLCHVGTNATYNDLVRVQVDEAFEKIFLKDCERE